MLVAVVLDVTHKEGQDNLLYVYPHMESAALLTLRGVVGASAGAVSSLFHEPMQSIEFSSNCVVAQVDLGNLLFALILDDCENECVLNHAVKSCYQLLQSAFGPPGHKCMEWKNQSHRVDEFIQRWFEVFMYDEKDQRALQHLFPESTPKLLPSWNLLMEVSGVEYLDCAKIDPQHAEIVLFYKKQLVVSGFNPPSTFLLYQWMMVSSKEPLYTTQTIGMIDETTNTPTQRLLTFLRYQHWELVLVQNISDDKAPVNVEEYQKLLERIDMNFTSQIAAPLTPSSDKLYRIIAHNKHHKTIVDSHANNPKLNEKETIAMMTKTISKMLKRYEMHRALHDIRTTPYIEHPKAPIADDPYILRVLTPRDSEGQEVGSGQISIFPTQYSIYRPEAYFAQLLHKQATRVRLPDGEYWIHGWHYAVWNVYVIHESKVPIQEIENLVSKLLCYG